MPKKKKHPKRHRPKPRSAPVTSTAIVPAMPPQTIVQGNRTRTLKREEIELLQKTVAKGTNPEEFMYFMTICRKHRIDPFTKQIYCVVWPTEQGKSHEVVIIMGIGGYRMTAARDHKDFGGTSKAVFTWPATPMKTPANRLIPETATVRAIRKGGEYSEAEVYWEEFAPRDLTAKRSDFWNRMPKHMLAKCAEALAIRKAFPDLSDIYTEEELSQRLGDFTEGGRQISVGGVAPSGKILENDYQHAHLAAQAIADAKNKGIWCERHQCPFPQCPADEHSDGEMEMMEAAERATKAQPVKAQVIPKGQGNGQDARNVTPKPSQATTAPSAPQRAPVAQQPTHKPPTAVPATELGGIWPKRAKKDSGKQEDVPGAQKAGKGSVAQQAPAGPTLLTGTLHNAVIGQARNQAPYVNAKINGAWYYCWSTALHDFLLNKRYPMVVEVWLDKRNQIVGLKRINDLHFDEDGRTPIVQRSEQQAGQKTLYG
jgi:phage recombination protein Bet